MAPKFYIGNVEKILLQYIVTFKSVVGRTMLSKIAQYIFVHEIIFLYLNT